MRFILLNQFGLVSGAPTGRILGELGLELARRGHKVDLITTGAAYGKPRRGAGRLVQEGLAHLSLFWRSLWRPRADAVISMTSPACLAVTAGVVARIHRARHFHWAMDIYPDLGVRLGEMKDGQFIRFLSSLTRRAYEQAARVVALDEDMRDYLQANYGVDSAAIEPFPPAINWPSPREDRKSAKRWLYSGNFGRAHEIDVLLQIQKKLEDRGVPAQLILQGNGPQFLSSQDRAKALDLRQIQWRAPVREQELGASLLQSDVLVVTRKAELKGLLLPSKLILAELSGRAILWIGDTDGKTAGRLRREGRHGVFAIEEVDSIATWLQSLFTRESSGQSVEPVPTDVVRQRTAAQWQTLFSSEPPQP